MVWGCDCPEVGVLAAAESQQQAVNTELLQSVSSSSLPNE